jgi:D-tyrosyl-tRNA(Tyr) deacylase
MRARAPSSHRRRAPDITIALREIRGRYAKSAAASVGTGEFGAMMDVELVNDGPVTLILEK